MSSERSCSITPGNSAWIAERAGVRRYDFVDNAQHFQVIPTKVGIQMFFFGVRLPIVIEQLLQNLNRNKPKASQMRRHIMTSAGHTAHQARAACPSGGAASPLAPGR
jgi:hypothetical protein